MRKTHYMWLWDNDNSLDINCPRLSRIVTDSFQGLICSQTYDDRGLLAMTKNVRHLTTADLQTIVFDWINITAKYLSSTSKLILSYIYSTFNNSQDPTLWKTTVFYMTWQNFDPDSSVRQEGCYLNLTQSQFEMQVRHQKQNAFWLVDNLWLSGR